MIRGESKEYKRVQTHLHQWKSRERGQSVGNPVLDTDRKGRLKGSLSEEIVTVLWLSAGRGSDLPHSVCQQRR